MTKITAKNVLGTKLNPCCFEPATGFNRDGYCNTNDSDRGKHIICAIMTDEFLHFSKTRGNNLMDGNAYFPGLKAGDKWCLCIERWLEAFEVNVAPKVILTSSHSACLEYVDLEILKKYEFKPH